MTAPVRVGGEFIVNTTTDNDQTSSVITALSDGRFVMTWRDARQSTDDPSGYATRSTTIDAGTALFRAAGCVRTKPTCALVAKSLITAPIQAILPRTASHLDNVRAPLKIESFAFFGVARC